MEPLRFLAVLCILAARAEHTDEQSALQARTAAVRRHSHGNMNASGNDDMLLDTAPSHCSEHVPMGSQDTIWTHVSSHPSCEGQYKSEGFGQCAGDRTSITLDMRTVSNKQGCYAYSSVDELTWSMHEIKEFSFDAEWVGCEHVWFAPLWLTPSQWDPPQGRSGEIDLIESCRSHRGDTVGTSIICSDHPDAECFEPQWGSADSSGGPIHMRARIDEDGTWTMEKCSLDQSNCQLVSRYPHFLSTSTATKNQDRQFHLVSDLWNGGSGDDGWKGCGQLNLGSQCRYSIANIKVTPKRFVCAQAGWDIYDPTKGYTATPASCCTGLHVANVDGHLFCQ